MNTVTTSEMDDNRDRTTAEHDGDESPKTVVVYKLDRPGPRGSKDKKLLFHAGAAVVLLVVAAAVAWVGITRIGGDSTPPTADLTSTIGPLDASPKVLSALAANVGHTVYWAGPIDVPTYEYTKASNGSVYVRYLPEGVAVGDSGATWLTIATYPFPNAYAALQKVANGKAVKIPGGGIAVVDTANPTSVHFAFPGAAYQGEVYDPSPARALEVATSGDIQPVPPASAVIR